MAIFIRQRNAGVLLIHPKAFPRNVKAGNSFTIPMPYGSNSISEASAEVFSKEAVQEFRL